MLDWFLPTEVEHGSTLQNDQGAALAPGRT